MDPTGAEIKFPVLKMITAWIAAISTSSMTAAWDIFMGLPWDKLAQCAAFVYSTLLIIELVRKRYKKETGDGSA